MNEYDHKHKSYNECLMQDNKKKYEYKKKKK